MMWFNKDKTQGLNLDQVAYWEYNQMDFSGEPPRLEVWISGRIRMFQGSSADEIYELLIKQKELLKG